MSRFGKRVLLRVVAAVAVLALVAVALGAFLLTRNLPGRDGARIPGLTNKVLADLDDRGLATVHATSVADAVRAQGFLTARERMFQLELLRRSARGRLAEVFGAAALGVDRKHRLYGFAQVADRAVALLPPEERADLEALASGVNAFLEARRGRIGVEFTILGITPEPWRPSDSVAVLLLMYEQLTESWASERSNSRLDSVPASVRAFLMPRATPDDVPLVPDTGRPSAPPVPELLEEAVPRAADLLPLAMEAAADLEIAGSNAWAVSGALTASGKPMLAGDPHLGIDMPALWLPMRFEVDGRRVEGVTLPGLPGVTLGRTDQIAWSFTNLMVDAQDLYRETIVEGRVVRGETTEPLTTRTETIHVRGGTSETLVVRESTIGPLVGEDLALAWTALDPRNLRLPNAGLLRARDAAEVQEVFDRFSGPPQNVVWAAADGSIGWRPAGLVIVRRPGTDGSVPYDGRDMENRWRGFVPQGEMPRVVDPPEGFVVTANQRVFGSSFPHVVATSWPSPARARRIRDLLAAARSDGRKLTLDDLERIQLDTLSEPLRLLAALFIPDIGSDPGLAALLSGWDGRASAEGPGYLVARTLRRALRAEVLRLWKARSLRWNLDEDLWNTLLAASPETWRRAGLGAKPVVLRRVIASARRDLERAWGPEPARWSWGEANRLNVHHPLGRIPGLSWLFDPPAPRQSGASQVVKASSRAYGQSMRLLVDWGDPAATTLVIPFGVSGHAGSPHHLDQHPFWRDGDPGGRATRLARPPAGAPIELVP